jgi:hypothetical protein
MCGTDKYLLIMTLVLALSSCIRTNPAPPARRVSIEEAQKAPRGAWIKLALTQKPSVEGELLAVHDGKIYVLTLDGLETVNAHDVESAVLSVYEGKIGGIALHGAFGTLSTLSHGFFLIFTAPIWIISSAVATRVQSGVGYKNISQSREDYQSFVAKLRPYARFPQGLPQVLAKPRGESGGRCFSNNTCARKARCDEGQGVCVPDESMGTQGGSCYPNGSCDPGLTCDEQMARCAPPADAPDAGTP